MLPTPVFWPGEFLGLYSSWGHKESFSCDNKEYSWLREQVHFAQFYRKQTIFRHFIFLASYNWTGLLCGLCCIALDSSSTQLHKKSQRIFTEFIFQTTQKNGEGGNPTSFALCLEPNTFLIFVLSSCLLLDDVLSLSADIQNSDLNLGLEAKKTRKSSSGLGPSPLRTNQPSQKN